EAEWEKALSFLGILPEDNNGAGAAVKPFSGPISKDKLAKEVPMITDPDLARKMKFQDNNSLVLDPEKELQDYNNLLDLKWSDFDRASFKTKLTTYGKDFYKIGNEMDMKSTQDCVIYYYREKMNQRFKNLIRKSQSGRGRRKKEKGEDTRLPPFKVFTLAEDEEFVPPVPYFPPADTEASVEDEGRQTPDILGPDDKRRAIIDAVSAPASPLGSPTELDRLNATWTEEESQKALRGFELFGRDFNAVAVMVTTKTPFQCKAFFNNHRRNAKEESHASSTSAVPASEGDQKKGKDSSAKKKSKTSRKRAESTPQVSVPLKLEAERVEEDEDPAGGEKKRKAADAVDTRKKPRKGTGEAGAVGVEGTDSAPRKTISYWSISEKAEFLKVLALHGKNFEAIARSLQTKSVIQVRNYFGNYKDKRELDDALDKYTNSVGQHIDPVPKVSLECRCCVANAPDEAPTDRSFSFPTPDQPYSPHLPPVQVPSRLSVSPTKIPSLKSLVALSNSPQYLPPMLDQRPPDSVQEMFPSGASSIPERVTLAPIQLAAVETGERPEGPEASSAAFPLLANESKLPPIKLTFKLAATEHSVADAGDSTEETMPLT
ncbi:nuclear receptor corepressor 2, partial [Kappamyces sp. JEL0680]